MLGVPALVAFTIGEARRNVNRIGQESLVFVDIRLLGALGLRQDGLD